MIHYNPRTAWKRFVFESRVLLEEEEKDEKANLDPSLEGDDSIDNQIDDYLSQYERTAKDSLREGKNWNLTIRRLLNEKNEDEEDPFSEPEEGEEEEGEGDDANEEDVEQDDEGDEENPEEDEEDSKPEKLTESDIDLNQFANDVSRLIENYDSLLEIKNTIIRRALKYISESYDKSAVDKLKEVLLDEHGLEAGSTKKDNEERFSAPPAERAIGAGGGGGGGGI
jgi:hypothetical protein